MNKLCVTVGRSSPKHSTSKEVRIKLDRIKLG